MSPNIEWKEVARLHFDGERYKEHSIDLQALSKAVAFQTLVEQAAKILWRRSHPDRERLPRHFENRVRMYLRKLEDGSVTMPLEVRTETQLQHRLITDDQDGVESDLREAIQFVHGAIGALETGTTLPDGALDVSTELEDWFDSLDPEEIVAVSAPGLKPATARAAFAARLEREQARELLPDFREVVGTVLEADVRLRTFQLWLNEAQKASVTFSRAQESAVVDALKDHEQIRLAVRGIWQVSPSGTPLRCTLVQTVATRRESETVFEAKGKAIEEALAEIARDISPGDWQTLPNDLTERLDHYLYGGE